MGGQKKSVNGAIKPYYLFAGELSVQQSLLLKGTRLVIPITIRLDIQDTQHEGPSKITKCRADEPKYQYDGLE